MTRRLLRVRDLLATIDDESNLLNLVHNTFPGFTLDNFWSAPRTRVILPPLGGFTTLVKAIEARAQQVNKADPDAEDSDENKVIVIQAKADFHDGFDGHDWWSWFVYQMRDHGQGNLETRRSTWYLNGTIFSGIANLVTGNILAALRDIGASASTKTEHAMQLSRAEIQKELTKCQANLIKKNSHVVFTIDPADWRSSITRVGDIKPFIKFIEFMKQVTGEILYKEEPRHGNIHAVFLNIDSLLPEKGLFEDWSLLQLEPLTERQLLAKVQSLLSVTESDFEALFEHSSLQEKYAACSSGFLAHGIELLRTSVAKAIEQNGSTISRVSLERSCELLGRNLMDKYDKFHNAFWGREDRTYNLSFVLFKDLFMNLKWPLQYGVSDVKNTRNIRLALSESLELKVSDPKLKEANDVLNQAVRVGWIGVSEQEDGEFVFRRNRDDGVFAGQWLMPMPIFEWEMGWALDLTDRSIDEIDPATARALTSSEPNYFIIPNFPRSTRPAVRLSNLIRYNLNKPIPIWVFYRLQVMRNGADPGRSARQGKGKPKIQDRATKTVQNAIGEECVIFEEQDWKKHFVDAVLPLDESKCTRLLMPLNKVELSYRQPGLVEKSGGYKDNAERIRFLFEANKGLFITKHHIVEGGTGLNPDRPLRADGVIPGLKEQLGLLSSERKSQTNDLFGVLWRKYLHEQSKRGEHLRETIQSLEQYYPEREFADLQAYGTGMLILPADDE